LQNFAGCIYIGHGSYIAPNVGLITSNHDIANLDLHEDPKDIVIGKCCWIGMNAVILPGVILGDRTIVAAGAVVTKSFIEGNAVIGGIPAKVLKRI
jgi:acetyltransferase-like isoleucine patch superfamily enzyme